MNEHSRDGYGSRSAAGAGGRVRREDAERTRPNRSWWGIFRPWERQAAGAGGRAGSVGNGDGGWSGVVDRAVEMGYRVIDEQIRQGQRAAREFSSQSYGPQSANRDLQELFVRSMRYYADTAALWLDFLGALPGSLGAAANPFAAPGAPRAGANGSGRQPPPAAGGEPQGGEERAISIQVSRPATVSPWTCGRGIATRSACRRCIGPIRRRWASRRRRRSPTSPTSRRPRWPRRCCASVSRTASRRGSTRGSSSIAIAASRAAPSWCGLTASRSSEPSAGRMWPGIARSRPGGGAA